MTTKKQYSIGDSAWIHGVELANNKLTHGQVVHKFILDGCNDVFYVIAVPTSVEDLLEVRTWYSISQDSQGPVGAFREGMENINSTKRYLSKIGVKLDILDFVDKELLNIEIENKADSTVNSKIPKKEYRSHRPNHKSFSRKKKQ